jgi:hypothetical protein
MDRVPNWDDLYRWTEPGSDGRPPLSWEQLMPGDVAVHLHEQFDSLVKDPGTGLVSFKDLQQLLDTQGDSLSPEFRAVLEKLLGPDGLTVRRALDNGVSGQMGPGDGLFSRDDLNAFFNRFINGLEQQFAPVPDPGPTGRDELLRWYYGEDGRPRLSPEQLYPGDVTMHLLENLYPGSPLTRTLGDAITFDDIRRTLVEQGDTLKPELRFALESLLREENAWLRDAIDSGSAASLAPGDGAITRADLSRFFNNFVAGLHTYASTLVRPRRQLGELTDLTADFIANPVQFTTDHMLNAHHIAPSPLAPPQGVTAPTAEQPLVDASNSVVSLNVNEHHGNAFLSVDSPGGPGAQAYYLQYANSATGHLAGIQGVPLHPPAGTPTTIVTGALNGCAIWALYNSETDSMTFVHDHSYSSGGATLMQQFLQNHPELSVVGSFTPDDYEHLLDNGTYSGASALIQYDAAAQQWMMVGQLNAPNVVHDGSTSELVNQPTGLAQQSGAQVVYLDPSQPVDISQYPTTPTSEGSGGASPDSADAIDPGGNVFPQGLVHNPDPLEPPSTAWVFPFGTLGSVVASMVTFLFGRHAGGSGRPEL